MKQILRVANDFLCAEDGAAAIEYSLVAVLVAVALMGSLTLLGENLANVFDSLTNKLPKPR